MMSMNTSIERVDTLVFRSSAIHSAIDPHFDGEPRYRRMLRNGIHILASSLRNGDGIDTAGAKLLTLPNVFAQKRQPLDGLSNLYADVKRATLDRDGNPETDARHAIHLMKMAVPYAREFYPELNLSKVAAYALIHDIIEAYAGDVPSLGMSPEQAKEKHANEVRALMRIQEEYGAQWPEFVALIEAYESLADPEACFVKTFDKLDPGFTHFYNQGSEITGRYGFSEEDFFSAMDEATVRMSEYSSEYPQLMEDRAELTRRIARVAFEKAA